ncbi:NAD-dependent epimerase/dehydratase family protein [Rhodococcus jostii]|uniref:NAD-dependent epimerase/dehydratase family protein n=1 Tax=Rhodococcus jostii TaxID=132919 RepID=UPI003630E695
MKVVVTGAAGFIGSSLVERLLDDGYDVIGIDSLTDYYSIDLKLGNLRAITSSKFKFLNIDINSANLDELLPDVDYIFHLAGQPGVRSSWGTEFETYTSRNILATQRLLEASHKVGTIKRFVYASSSSIYGDSERYPTFEADAPHPLSPYGVSKLAAEHLCSLYANNFGVPTISLRYFTVYGPRQRPDMAFTRFLEAAVRGKEVTIYGDGEQVRDFTYVGDIVRANILAATVPDVPPGTILNVSGGSHVSVNQVLGLVAEISGAGLNVTYGAGVAGDVRRTGGSTDKIRSVLGWTPTVDLSAGLTRQLEWVNRPR